MNNLEYIVLSSMTNLNFRTFNIINLLIKIAMFNSSLFIKYMF